MVSRYAHLFWRQLRASLLVTFQYRIDFILSLVMSAFWTVSSLLPLVVLFDNRPSFSGWSRNEALLVVAWFNFLKGIQASLIQPSMQDAVLQIRKGTLDFVLIKPADAQFLISTNKFELRQINDILVAFGILTYALWHLPPPSFWAVFAAFILLLCATAILYAIWVMVMSLAFVFVKVDNLTYLFSSLFDAARWPGSIFRGALAFLFTFVLPLTVMTTFPALALLQRLQLQQFVWALCAAALFLGLSRWVWNRSIRNYTSAGG